MSCYLPSSIRTSTFLHQSLHFSSSTTNTRLLRPLLPRVYSSSSLFSSASFSFSSSSSSSSTTFTFSTQPCPPRLPAAQQIEFEHLQRAGAALHSSHTATATTTPTVTSSSSRHAAITTTAATTTTTAVTTTTTSSSSSPPETKEITTKSTTTRTLSGGLRKGAPAEFSGTTNPRTGEVDGPKNEPLRWGSAGDWSYNGRVTDF